jgi:hypothetical protein
MYKLSTMLMLGIGLCTWCLSAKASSLNSDYMQVTGIDESQGYFFMLSAGDSVIGQSYYIQVQLRDLQRPGPPLLDCGGTTTWDPVETTGSAKYGESMFNTGDGTGANGIYCSYGANLNVLAQCNFDGQIWRNINGSAISKEMGEILKYKTNDKYATVECRVEVDGLVLDVTNLGVGSSSIRREQEVD